MNARGEHKFYSYVVATDNGVAPNVAGETCTLCLCKPRIRRSAQPGDWIVGLWPKRMGPYNVTYVMQVGRKLSMQEYDQCGEFDQKKPDRTQTPDNIYEFDAPLPRQAGDFSVDGHPFHLAAGRREMLVRRRPGTSVHEHPKNLRRDIGGHYALIADRYWYFGGDKRELPEAYWSLDLPGSRRGHKVSWLSSAELAGLTTWLDGFGRGVLGEARDASG